MANPALLDLVGNTPLVAVTELDTGPCRLFLKIESSNPSGSIKDRIAKFMIERAEQEGKIKPGDTLVEGTAGNTGLGLAQLAVLKGYKLVVVMPDKMSRDKMAHLRAMGAEVIMTRSDVSKGEPEYYQDVAMRIAAERDHAFYMNQFGNSANPDAHEQTTAPELLEQMDGNVDAIVMGVGTGGHLTGISRYMQKTSPNTQIILADPEGSILAEYIKTGTMTEKGSWLVEGIGEDYIPDTCDLSRVSEAFTVSDAESFAAARGLLKKTGVFAGSSTGTVVSAALTYCRAQTEPKRVVTFVYDSGNKYLSKMYNDDWMRDNGFSIED